MVQVMPDLKTLHDHRMAQHSEEHDDDPVIPFGLNLRQASDSCRNSIWNCMKLFRNFIKIVQFSVFFY